MSRPEDYVHIRAWGNMLGSYDYYIRQEQERAAKADAPLDAIYELHDYTGGTGTWACYSEVKSEFARARMDQHLEKLRKNT